MTPITVLVLAAGDDRRGPHQYPTVLHEVDGVPLLQRIVETCGTLEDVEIVCLLRSDQLERWAIADMVAQLTPRPRVIAVHGDTAGAACTALLAIDELVDSRELLLVTANEYLSIDLAAQLDTVRSTDADAAVLTFDSVHPRYSYAAVDESGIVTRLEEKHPISRRATTGVYWARRSDTMLAALKNLIRKGDAHEGRYFIAPALNQIILAGGTVRAFALADGVYHPLKDVDQLARDSVEHGPISGRASTPLDTASRST